MLFWIALIVLIALLTFIRLAPSDPSHWHQPPDVCENKDFKAGVKRLIKAEPDSLARLHALILAMPRTEILAGSLDDQLLTYITRSAVFGFPDYTTVQQEGDSLKIYARLRFGRADTGVNRARVERWISALQP